MSNWGNRTMLHDTVVDMALGKTAIKPAFRGWQKIWKVRSTRWFILVAMTLLTLSQIGPQRRSHTSSNQLRLLGWRGICTISWAFKRVNNRETSPKMTSRRRGKTGVGRAELQFLAGSRSIQAVCKNSDFRFRPIIALPRKPSAYVGWRTLTRNVVRWQQVYARCDAIFCSWGILPHPSM